MKSWFSVGSFLVALSVVLRLTAAESPRPWDDAERSHVQGAYSLAGAAYARIPTNGLPIADRRWIAFRIADDAWRAAVSGPDAEAVNTALRSLDALAPQDAVVADQDTVWAEVQESIGDLHTRRGDSREWVGSRYTRALDWWAGRSDLETARARYLAVVWKWHSPPHFGRGFQGYSGDIPLRILDNAVAIARSPKDVARAHRMRALAVLATGDADRQLSQVEEDFKASLASGRSTDDYDETLIRYAEWLASSGRIRLLPDGHWVREPDFVRALEFYRRFLAEFKKGESRHWEQARTQVNEITQVSLSLSVPGVFLPGSEIQITAGWRNTDSIRFSIVPVDLTQDLRFDDPRANLNGWQRFLKVDGRKPLREWTLATSAAGDHLPAERLLTLTNRLPAGAYLVEARAGSETTREVVLVSDATLVLKSIGRKTLAWMVDASTGRPLPGTTIRQWIHTYPNGNQPGRWDVRDRMADSDGVAVLESDAGAGVEQWVAAHTGVRQAFALTWLDTSATAAEVWKIHAFTDRPAYRPGEGVHWKLTARRRAEGEWTTPAGRTLWFEITDPRGSRFTNGSVQLNAFGSASGSFIPSSTVPLGEYRAVFRESDERGQVLGSATLFRLEEYKLPEFEVKIEVPEEDIVGGGRRRKMYRPGERMEVAVQADYYFGGPVADAQVEVLIRQSPFHWEIPQEHEHPWLQTAEAGSGGGFGINRGRRWMGPGAPSVEVKRETVKTDSRGRATVSVETDAAQGDVAIEIEARVVDASRREVTGTGTVRATREGYAVELRPAVRLPRPGDTVRIAVRSIDPNGQPVKTTGRIRVTRDTWWEVWLDSLGNEIEGRALKAARENSPVWPPRPGPGMKEWRLKSSGYRSEDIRTVEVALDAAGRGEWTFQPDREGFYRLSWDSPDRPDPRIPNWTPRVRAEAMVWVSTRTSSDLSYRQGGLELIVDKDSVNPGGVLPVLVVGPQPDRWVLLSVATDQLESYRLVHLSGTTARVEIPITERLTPNFWIHGALVNDRELFVDQKELVVPPIRNLVSVDLKPDHVESGPHGEGTFTVTTRDSDGHPVSAEVALSVLDESVLQIQSEFAADPRTFFLGDRHGQRLHLASSFEQRRFIRLIRTKTGAVVDDRVREDEMAVASDSTVDASNGIVRIAGFGGGGFRRAGSMNAPAPVALGLATGSMGRSAGMARFGLMRSKTPEQMTTAMFKSAAMDVLAGGAGEGGAIVVRSDFRSTAFWQPDIRTGSDGTARVVMQYPETLTRWQATARAVTTGNGFGQARTTTRTVQPLVARLELPRFLVVGDSAVVSAVIHNQSPQALSTRVRLTATGVVLTAGVVTVELAVGAEKRINWTVGATTVTNAVLRLVADAGTLSDGVERSMPVFAHGLQKELTRSGKAMAGDVTVRINLPARAPGSTRMEVRVTPSLALTMLDALPYLADYPYGCTEQTMSRFLPAVVVRQTLRTTGLDPETALSRVFGGISTNAAGAVSPALGSKKDLTRLGEMTDAGLKRLADYQHGDGSWGWWKEGDSDAWMTAYVVWGLKRAKRAGVDGVEADRIRHGEDWLAEHLVEADGDAALQTWMMQALVESASAKGVDSLRRLPALDKAVDRVWRQRDELSAYSRALFLMVLHRLGDESRVAQLVNTVQNGVVRDDLPDASVLIGAAGNGAPPTVHWGRETGWFRWQEGGVETTAAVVRALLQVDPKNALIEPAVNWLLKNRRGAQWNNTRDTALVMLALNDYLEVSGELNADLDFEVIVNGHAAGRHQVNRGNLLNAPTLIPVDPAWVSDANEVRIVRHGGTGPLYFAVSTGFFSAEEPVSPAGNEVFVRRDYFRLIPVPTLLKGIEEKRESLGDGAKIESGERIETVVTLESKNDLEYLLLEDLKPAGFEAEEQRSGGWISIHELVRSRVTGPSSGSAGERGERTGRSTVGHPEWRDRSAAVFISRLPQGLWELRYRFRATTPGRYHALPLAAGALYVPEIRGNSAEIRTEVTERP